MTHQTGLKIIDPRTIRPIWYVAAVVISVAALIAFYILQTRGYSDKSRGFSIDISEPSSKITQG